MTTSSDPHRSHVPWRRRVRTGVTLIELAIVLVMIGLVTAIAMPRTNPAKQYADGAQRLVRGTLMRAQRLAVQRQYLVGVAFDETGRRMRIIEDSNQDGRLDGADRSSSESMPEGTALAASPTPLGGAPTTGSGAVRGTRLQTFDGLPTVLFYRHGAASTDAVAYVSASRRGQVERRAVTVTQTTGRSESFDLTATGWRRGTL